MNPIDPYNQIDLHPVNFEQTALILVFLLPFAAIIGFMTGKYRRKVLIVAGKDVDHVVGETTLSAILALLGLLLAFSFGNALSQAQDRKATVVDEAAALGTAFLRADFVEEPHRTALKQALLDYTKTRVLPGDGSVNSFEKAREFLRVSLAAQAQLWPLTLKATQDPMPPAIKSFVAGAVNEALDAHLYRVRSMSNPVSEITHMMMLATALMSLFLLGNRAGLVGSKLTWRIFVFATFLFIVMISIVDTQLGEEGFVRLDDTALRVTILDMEAGM